MPKVETLQGSNATQWMRSRLSSRDSNVMICDQGKNQPRKQLQREHSRISTWLSHSFSNHLNFANFRLLICFFYYISFKRIAVCRLNVLACVAQKFCQFLKYQGTDPSSVVKVLEKVESHLASQGGPFMLGEQMGKADCYVLPILQHVRVAGKVGPFLENDVNLWEFDTLGLCFRI